MQVDLARYDDVVHSIYDAALRPEQWDSVISRIAELFEAQHGLLFTWAHRFDQGGFAFTHNVYRTTLARWLAEGMRDDPFVRAANARGLMVEGVSAISSDLVPMEVLRKTDFYREVWEPEGITSMCGGVVFDATDAHKMPTALSVLRGLAAKPFDRDDAEVLRRLLAHLSRAMAVMFHLRDSQWRVAANEAALDRLGCGVVLVDGDRKVQFVNKKAQTFLERSDTLLLGSTHSAKPLQMHLQHRLAHYERDFQQSIAQALQPLQQDAVGHFSKALLLPTVDGKPALVMHVMPLAPSHGFATEGARAKAIVFLYDLQSATSVEPTLLCKLFDLTQAEARAALQLTQGGGLEQMASRLGVSLSTFKTQLQAAYMKSGTHRQTDLLKLLLALVSE